LAEGKWRWRGGPIRLAANYRKSEAYGLLSQIRRAAVSVPSNIAEGHGRLTIRSFDILWENAHGSLYEMENAELNWLAILDTSMRAG